MAKKSKDLDINDLDDLDFGLDDFDFETGIDGGNDSRTPITKLSSSFLTGVKGDLTDSSQITRRLKKIMPKEYSTSIDLIDDVSGTAGDLYNTITRETASGVKDFKRASNKLLGKHKEKLPKKLAERLEKMLKTDDDYKRLSEEGIRDSEVTSVLTEIFATQVEKDHEDKARDRAEKSLRDGLEDKKHKGLISLLSGMRQDIGRQVTYQDQIAARVQRKSLELQYRQFFVAKDMLKIAEQHSKDTKEALKSITLNTGLPEYRKIELNEVGGQMLRDRFMRGVQNKIVDFTQNFGSRLSKNLEGTFKSFGENVNDKLSSAAAMMGSEGGPALDPMDILGSVAGSSASNILVNNLSVEARKMIAANPEMVKRGHKLARNVRDLPRILNEWAKKDHGYGLTGHVKRFAADMIGSQGLETDVKINRMEESDKAAIFDKLTRRSIVEVIPGFLSRIHHEIYSLRTGTSDPDARLGFNVNTGNFETVSKVRKSIQQDIFRKSDFEDTRSNMLDIYQQIDPDNKMSVEARQVLGEEILKSFFTGDSFDIRKFSKGDKYSDKVSHHIRDEIEEILTDRFGVTSEYDEEGNEVRKYASNDDTEKRLNAISRSYERIGNTTNDPRGQIEAYLQIGQREALESLGIISGNQINYDDIFKIYQRGSVDEVNAEEEAKRFEEERYSRHWENRKKEEERQNRKPDEGVRGAAINMAQKISFKNLENQPMFQKIKTEAKRQGIDLYQKFRALEIVKEMENKNPRLGQFFQTVDAGELGSLIEEKGKSSKDFFVEHFNLTVKESEKLYEQLKTEEGRETLLSEVKEVYTKRKGQTVDFYNTEVDKFQKDERFINAKKTVDDAIVNVNNDKRVRTAKVKTKNLKRKVKRSDAYKKTQTEAARIKERLDSIIKEEGAYKTSDQLLNEAKGSIKKTWENRDAIVSDWGNRLNQVGSYDYKVHLGEGGRFNGWNRYNPFSNLGIHDASGVVDGVQPLPYGPSNNTNSSHVTENGEDIPKGYLGEWLELQKEQQSTLISLLTDIRTAVGGEKGEVSENTEEIIKAINEIEKDGYGEQQTVLLSRILENIEAIGGMMAKGDEESWLNLRDIKKKTGRVLSKISGGVSDFYTGSFRMAGGVLSGTGQMGRNILGRLFSRKTEFATVADVYVKGKDTPSLEARKMLDGEYRDSITGKVIKQINDLSDLKGDIVDASGNIVATAKELSEGIFDNVGRKIGGSGILSSLKNTVTSASSKFFGIWGKTAASPFKLLSKMKSTVTDLVNRPIDIYVKGEEHPRLLAVVMKNGGYVSSITSKPIFKILDIDGDVLDKQGNVVLSLSDMTKGLVDVNGRPVEFLKRLASRAMSLMKLPIRMAGWGIKKAKDLLSGGANILGRITGGITDSFGLTSSKQSLEKADKQITVLEEIRDILKEQSPGKNRWDNSGSGFRDGSWQEKLASRKEKDPESTDEEKKTEKESPIGKLGNMLKGFLAGLIPGMGGGGLVDGDVNIMGLPSFGRGAKAAGKKGLLSRGLGALRNSRVAGMLGTAGRAVGGAAAAKMAAGGILGKGLAIGAGILSLPILAKVAIIGGTAALGYYAYKRLTRIALDPMGKVRFIQYGVRNDDQSQLAKVLYLEDQLSKFVSINNGEVSLDAKGLELEKLAKGFGVDTNNPYHAQNFGEWFTKRFLPIYLHHRGVLSQISKSYRLKSIDKSLSVPEKLEMLEAVRSIGGDWEVHPYTINNSPFTPEGRLNISADEIDKVILEIKQELEKNNKGSLFGLIKPRELRELDIPVVAGMATVNDKEDRDLSEPTPPPQSGRKTELLVEGEDVRVITPQRGLLKAIDAIRYRTYGLTVLDTRRVVHLSELEEEVMKYIKFDTQHGAHFTGNPNTIGRRFYSRFDIGTISVRGRRNWRDWFSTRFLQTFLTYLNGLGKLNSDLKVAMREIDRNPGVALDIAIALQGLILQVGDEEVPVWEFTTSPYGSLVLNVDSTSVEENMATLRMSVSDKPLLEERKVQSSSESGRNVIPVTSTAQKDEPRQQPKPNTPSSSGNRGSVTEYRNTQSSNYHNDRFVTGGSPVIHQGSGLGGSINDIPLPKGDGSWDAHKDTIVAAAMMAGVDPGIMAAKAGLESSFRSKVKAGTSTATGLYQFIEGTWNEMLAKYGAKYGINPNTPRSDPRANALMAAEYLKENGNSLQRHVERDLTDTDYYAAHFLGAGGARRLLTAVPSASAVAIFPSEARANPDIFYSGGRARTIAEVYSELDRRMGKFREPYGTEARSMAANFNPTVTTGNETVASITSVNPHPPAPSVVASPRQTMIATADISTRDSLMQTTQQDVSNRVEQQQRSQQVALVRERESYRQTEDSVKSLKGIAEILTRSLSTQVNMDNKLGDLVKIIGQHGFGGQLVEHSEGDITDKDRARSRQNEMAFDPRTTPTSVIDLTRRKTS